MLLSPTAEIVLAQNTPSPTSTQTQLPNTLWKTQGTINNRSVNAKGCLGAFCGPGIIIALTFHDLFVGTTATTTTTTTTNPIGGFIINILIVFIALINIGLLIVGIIVAKKIPKKFDREEDYLLQFLLLLVYFGLVFLIERLGAFMFGVF